MGSPVGLWTGSGMTLPGGPGPHPMQVRHSLGADVEWDCLVPLLSTPFLGFGWILTLCVPQHGFNKLTAFAFSSPGYTEPPWVWAPSSRDSWENPPWSP